MHSDGWFAKFNARLSFPLYGMYLYTHYNIRLSIYNTPLFTLKLIGQSRHLVNVFYTFAIVLILSSIVYLVLEVAQLYYRLHKYLSESENYIQVIMFISVIIFVFPVGQNSCWCLPGWKWQIGALAVFLAWINLLLLIRYIPWLRVGEHSTMLFNVYINFLKLIYLPILLVVTFAIPLYMLLIDALPPEVDICMTITAMQL